MLRDCDKAFDYTTTADDPPRHFYGMFCPYGTTTMSHSDTVYIFNSRKGRDAWVDADPDFREPRAASRCHTDDIYVISTRDCDSTYTYADREGRTDFGCYEPWVLCCTPRGDYYDEHR